MAAICVDVGTTLIKAVAYDGGGRELTLARQSTAISRTQSGHSEQDMPSVWNAVVFAIRTVVQKIPETIDFISLTAQGDGCWLVDKSGSPTGPAILWNDSRAKQIVERWERSGVIASAYEVNGSRHFAGLPHAILAWLHENDPQRLAHSHKALYCNGWIFWNLTGEFAVDESDASAPFLDIRSRTYSPHLLNLYGMEWAEHLLPKVLTNNQRVSPLHPRAAAELGLKPGVNVVMSSYDVASTALGAGVVRQGQACSVLGTTLCTEIVKDLVDTAQPAAGLCLAYNVPGTYLRAFPTLAGTEVFSWMQNLMSVDHPGDFGRLGREIEPGANGLLFLPYFSAAGERNPFYNPAARGTLLGLSFEHDRAHLAKALLEGLSLVVQDCLQAANASPSELRLCGGGAKDEIWSQMIADVTNLPVACSEDSEVGAKGAFIQGTVSLGLQGDFEEAAKAFVQTRRIFEPDKNRADQYRDLYGKFIDAREIVQQAWTRMDSGSAHV